MKSNLNVWQELYTVIQQWNEIKPWTYIGSNDWIKISFENEDSFYCSIMGLMNDCICISIYTGDEGYSDLMSITAEPIDKSVTKYLMYEETCLTFYMGDREEVPTQQKKIIKELGLKFRGRGNWPYFISYKKRYFPYHINDEQAQIFIKVIKKLIEIVTAYANHEIDIKFNEEEIINAYQSNGQWFYEPLCLPEAFDKFTPIEIDDEEILQQIHSASDNNHGLIMDLTYLNISISDKSYPRPINSLLFIVLDEESQMILGTHLLDPEDDEISLVLSFLVDYILKTGKPSRLFVRNPIIWAAVVDICEKIDIELIVTPLQMVDSITEDMVTALNK